jgi:hypothetical protein
MAVQNELWLKAAQENLYEALSKITPGATDDSDFLNALTVNIPNAGAPASVLKNPARPLTVDERTDNVHNYNIDEWVIAPRLSPFKDNTQLSYPKLQSLINDVLGGLPERVMRELLINWYTDNTYKVTTTGANYAGHAPAATGNRKGLTLAELMAAARALDNQKLPSGDRYLFVDTAMFYQLLDVIGITAYRDAALLNQSTLDLPKVAGFQIIPVTAVAYVSSTDVIRPFGHAGAASDNAVALAVHKSAVSFAVGDIKIFQTANDPIFAGDVVSGAIMAGGKYRRSDKKGVVPIIQAT